MKLSYINSNKYSNVKEVLKAEFLMSDRLLLKLKKLNKIYLNESVTYVGHTLVEGDLVECYLDYEEDNSNIVTTNMNLNIIYEDDSYLIINKPAGIPVHPSMEHYTDSLSNGIAFYFNKIGLKKKIRPVNRLDKDTSGLVIFAKNEYVQECLVKQMKSKEFVKKYIAICGGHLENLEGTINAPITRKGGSIIEREVNETGDVAITHYRVLSSDEITALVGNQAVNCDVSTLIVNSIVEDIYTNVNYDIIECTLETGRTHQIRVHFAYLGHSLLGDTLYGSSSVLIQRQALHAYGLEFVHPITRQKVKYVAEIPEDMQVLF